MTVSQVTPRPAMLGQRSPHEVAGRVGSLALIEAVVGPVPFALTFRLWHRNALAGRQLQDCMRAM
jgi:hypothetical protein